MSDPDLTDCGSKQTEVTKTLLTNSSSWLANEAISMSSEDSPIVEAVMRLTCWWS